MGSRAGLGRVLALFTMLWLLPGCTALFPGGGRFPVGALNGAVPTVPVRPPVGFLFTQVKAPLTTSADSSVPRTRKGQASSLYLREPFFGTTYGFGDASIKTAAEEGRIEQVAYAEYNMLLVLGFFGRLDVIVHGE